MDTIDGLTRKAMLSGGLGRNIKPITFAPPTVEDMVRRAADETIMDMARRWRARWDLEDAYFMDMLDTGEE